MRLYKLVYDQNNLTITIKRSLLICNKVVTRVKINIENESAVQLSAMKVRDIIVS